MADPPSISLFQWRFLTGDKPLLRLDDEFINNHTKVLLSSDVSSRIWEVKLDGNRLAGGWEEFAAAHRFKDGDVLVFRHDGEESFHVSVSSRSTSVDTDTSDDDDDDDDDWSEYDESKMLSDSVNVTVKESNKAEADSSSSEHSCFFKARVTPSSLANDRLDLCRDVKIVSFGKHKKKQGEIDLVNEKGMTWRLILSRNSSSGSFYIRQGWVNFCSANNLREGDLCEFKLSQNGERPLLWLCPQEYRNDHEVEEEECPKAVVGVCNKEKSKLGKVSKGKEKKNPSPFLQIKLTPNKFKTGQLYISSVFMADHGIKKPREMILLNKDGRKWTSYLNMTGQSGSEWFYLRRGWKEMCKANGVKGHDSFELELIRKDENLIFKFCSKIENHESMGEVNRSTRKKRACETPLQGRTVAKTRKVETKRKTVSLKEEDQDDDERGRRTGDSNKPTTNSRRLQRKKPQSCSVSDQVSNVKRCIQDTLNTVRQFRAELKIREKNLEASLKETDAVGEMILGISQMFNNKLASTKK